MITVEDRLTDVAETETERQAVGIWSDEGHDDLSARQRAWQEVDARIVRGELRLRW